MKFALSKEQINAVRAEGNPLVIIAPAGSGKTAVLSQRIAERIANHETRATQCVAVSFTQAAAWELNTRVAQLTETREVRCGTFHSHALSLLRLREEVTPSQRVPRILADAGPVLAELAPRVSQQVRDRVVREYGWLQAVGGTPRNYPSLCRSYERPTFSSMDLFLDLVTQFEAHKWRHNIADFGDLLLRAANALAEDPAFARRASLESSHFYVDEFQDINPSQLRLLSTWVGSDHPDLTVVGDPRQAIYTWNGSDPRILESLEAIYPDVKVVELTTNFRSSTDIVALSDQILVSSSQTKSARISTQLPVLQSYGSVTKEVEGVLRYIRELHYKGIPYKNIAVLARTVAALKPFSEALTKAEIPHSLPGRSSLGSHALTRALMAKLGAEHSSVSGACDLFENMLATTDPQDPASNILSHLLALASEIRRTNPGADLSLLNELITTGRAHQLDMVTVTTFHRSKGLQWYAVLATGLTAKSTARAASPLQLDEERRLIYVAATRATDMLSLSWSGEQPTPFLSKVNLARTTPRTHPQGSNDPLRTKMRTRLSLRNELVEWAAQQAKTRQIRPELILSAKDIDALVNGENPDTLRTPGLRDPSIRSSLKERLAAL